MSVLAEIPYDRNSPVTMGFMAKMMEQVQQQNQPQQSQRLAVQDATEEQLKNINTKLGNFQDNTIEMAAKGLLEDKDHPWHDKVIQKAAEMYIEQAGDDDKAMSTLVAKILEDHKDQVIGKAAAQWVEDNDDDVLEEKGLEKYMEDNDMEEKALEKYKEDNHDVEEQAIEKWLDDHGEEEEFVSALLDKIVGNEAYEERVLVLAKAIRARKRQRR